MKKSVWIGLCLLLTAGMIIVGQWRTAESPVVDPLRLDAAKRAAIASAASGKGATSPAQLAGQNLASPPKSTLANISTNPSGKTNSATRLVSVAVDPEHPYRLKNSDKSTKELFSSDRAILLRNAVIDSERPVADLNIPKHLKAAGDAGSYVVQATGRTSDRFREILTATGAEIVSYIPNNAYLVKASAEVIKVLRQIPEVQNTIPYEPYYKLAPALLPGAIKQERLPVGQPLRIALFPGTRERAVEKLKRGGAMIAQESRFPFGPLLTVVPRPDQVAAIAGMAEVQLMEIYPRYRLLRELERIRVGAADPADPTANHLSLDGSGVIVGVNGSGVQTNHVDLNGRVIMDLVNYATPFEDGTGHETHVAGIIAGSGAAEPSVFTNGSFKGANYAGVAPAAEIFPLSIFPATGEPVVGNHPTLAGVTGAITDITVTFESAGYTEMPSVFIFDSTGYTTNTNSPFQQLTPGSGASFQPILTDGRVTGFTPISYGSNYTASNTVIVLTSPWDEFQTITNQARNTNVYIVNNSWSVSVQEYDITAATYDAAVRDSMPHWEGEQGISYVFAAGNSGFGTTDGQSGLADSIESPATAKNVITVGAIETLRLITQPANDTNGLFPNVLAESDTDSQVADFSSRGNVGIGLEGEFGRFKPDLVAPGTWVLSSSVSDFGTNRTIIDDQIGNNDLRYESGTSMAAPFVSGLLALMQQAFDSSPFNRTNSPALNKALLINSARPANTRYDYSPRNVINYQGWGVPALTNALPDLSSVKMLESRAGSQSATVVLMDQGGVGTNRLQTGQTHNFDVSVNGTATNQSLRITLAWTDPPGNPAAGIKLVNDLDLVVSNTVTSDVFVGNFIPSGSDFTVAGSLNNPNPQERAVADFVNNVENVYIRGPFTNGANDFKVYVSANRVNVNSSVLDTNGVAQDYVLVVSTSEGAQVTVTHDPTTDSITNSPTQFLLNGIPVLEQRVGAYSTFQSDVSVGTTNQWNFYVFTNDTFNPITTVNTNVTGTITNQSTNVVRPLAAGTNVAFATFFPPNLGRSRNIDADIDVYMTRSSDPPPGGHLTISNLDPTIIYSSKTLRSTNRGGLELISLDSVAIGEVFYIGVKAEDQQAGQYSFLALSTDEQFTITNADGSFDIPFFSIPAEVPDGNPGAAGGTNLFGIMLVPTNVYNPVFSNSIAHENHADLSVVLSHDGTDVFLHNHSQYSQPGGVFFTQTRYFNATLYDPNNPANNSNATLPDGPGDMADFMAQNSSAFGTWVLQVTDDALNHTGAVVGASLRIGDTGQNRNRNRNGNRTVISFEVDPGESFIDFVFVDLTATNLKVSVSGAPATAPGVDLLVSYNQVPAAPFFTNSFTTNINGTNYTVTNVNVNPNVLKLLAPDTSSSQLEVNSGTDPALRFGPWFARVVNNTSTRLPLSLIFETEHNYGVGGFDGHSLQINHDLVDMASTNLTLAPDTFRTVADIEVAVGVEHPRPADLVYELFSPSGTRVLLAENRGDLNRTNFYANFAEGTNAFTSIITDPATGAMLHFDQLLPVKAITNQFTNVITPPLLMFSNTVNVSSVHTFPEAIASPGNALYVAGALRTNVTGHTTNWGMVLSYTLPMTNNMLTNWLSNWPEPMDGPVYNQGETVSFGDLVVNEDGVFLVGTTNNEYFPVVQSAAGGPQQYVLDYDTGCRRGTFNFDIDTLTVPDHYHVYHEGRTLFAEDYPGVGTSGFVTHNLGFPSMGPSGESFVRLVINQGSNDASGTLWFLQNVSATCSQAATVANRSLVLGYPTDGPAVGGVATNGATMISRAMTNNPYGYPGDDRLFGIDTTLENDTNMLYVVGSAQIAASGNEKFFLSKMDTDGNVHWTATEQFGAAATLSVNGAGEITGATIICPGTNYSAAPGVNIVDLHSQGSGATASTSIGANGNVTAISITSPGTGYRVPAIYIDKPALSDNRSTAGHDLTVVSNSLIIAVGASNNTASANSISPVVWALDTNGCLLWTSDAGFSTAGAGAMNGGYLAVGQRRTNFYAVGRSNDFAADLSFSTIQSWDYHGNLLASTNYSHLSDASPASKDYFDDLVVTKNPDRIYAIGTRTNADSSTDAILVEIEPDTLEALSTTIIDKGGNEAGKGVETDGRDLYVLIQTDPGGQFTTEIQRYRIKNFYLPEESLHKMQGEPTWFTSGNFFRTNWTLRITDTRAGGSGATTPQVKYWGINFTYAAVGSGYTLIDTDRGFTGSVLANQPRYFSFDVTPGTTELTINLGTTNPVNLVVSGRGLPSLDDPESQIVATNSFGGEFVLSEANGFRLAPGRHYLLVQTALESSGGDVSLSLEANPAPATPTVIPLLENGVSTPGTISAGPGLSYYSFTVPANSTGARFELATLGDDLNLFLRREGAEQALPSLTEYDVRSITVGATDEAIFLVPDGNSTNALSPGTWFLAVENRSTEARNFNLKATSYNGLPYDIVSVTSGQAVSGLAMVGNAPAVMYRMDVSSPRRGLMFEVRNLDGNGDLIVRKGAPPVAGTFDSIGSVAGNGDERVLVHTNAADLTLVGDWHFGVLNREETRVAYTAVAKEPLNGLLVSETPPLLSTVTAKSPQSSTPDFGFDLNVVPGETYQVQFAHEAQGPWFILTNIVAPADGAIEFVHKEAVSNPSLFYRVQQVPPQ